MCKFKLKFDDLICPECGEKLYIHKIWDKLSEQHEPNTGINGYTSILVGRCKCGKKYKVIFDCHEVFGYVTVVVNKIVDVTS